MVRVAQGSFNGGILSADMYARTDTEKFDKGLKDAVNVIVRPQGGAANRAGLETVTAFDTSGAEADQYLVPFAFNTEQTYQLEFTDDVFRVIKDGAYVLSAATAKAVSAITAGAVSKITMSSSGDAATFSVGELAKVSDPSGTHALHDTLVKVSAVSGSDVSYTVYDGTTLDTTAGAWGAVGAGATLAQVYQTTHQYELADLPSVRFMQDADTMYLVHVDYPPQKLTRAGHDDWTVTAITFEAGITPPDGGAATRTLGSGATASVTYSYVVASIREDTGEESLPSAEFSITNNLAISGSINHLSWTARAEAERYVVYKKDAGTFGYVGTTTGTAFSDQNIVPDVSRGPRVDRQPFNSAGNYPSIVSFYEQRVAYGATKNDPQLVEMSRTDNIENFGTSYPLQEDDASRFRVRAQQVNRIRAFIPHASFAILTSGGEWELAAQGDGAYIRPDKRRLSPVTFHGCAEIAPVITGNFAVFVEPSGSTIRDFPLGSGEAAGDLTILCRDLFLDRTVTSWAYAYAPHGVLWTVMSDGALLSMTYIPEHDVWAWTRQEIAGTDAKVKQVSVIREDNADVPYFVVSRTINGATVTTTERMARREDVDVTEAYYLDGGFKAKHDDAVSYVSGYLHLRGETVSALVDGDVVEQLTVDLTGGVDLGTHSGTKVSVGLPYVTLLQTLPINIETEQLGSSEGRYMSVSEVALKLTRSRGVEAGMNLQRMNELKEWDDTMVDGPIPLRTHTPLVTVDGDWVRDATMYVRQKHPLPFTLTGLAPEWVMGE